MRYAIHGYFILRLYAIVQCNSTVQFNKEALNCTIVLATNTTVCFSYLLYIFTLYQKRVFIIAVKHGTGHLRPFLGGKYTVIM